jgi:hypothetical protein
MEGLKASDEHFVNVLGLDLGRLSDPSALAVLRWPTGSRGPVRQRYQLPPRPQRHYRIEGLKRWPLGTPYLKIIDSVLRNLSQPIFGESPWLPQLVVDATGVGDAVAEMVWEKITETKTTCSLTRVTITAGSAVSHVGDGRFRVAKSALVSILRRLLGTDRLHIEVSLPDASVLYQELQTFQVKITEAKNETFESWRERDHDDLVLAVALAAWAAETTEPHFSPPEPSKAGRYHETIMG